MTQQTIDVEGLPKGWKAVAYRRPKKGIDYVFIRGRCEIAGYCEENCYHLIVVQKIQPREIRLRETSETRSVSYGDWYENNRGMIGQWTEEEFDSSLCFRIWKEVKE